MLKKSEFPITTIFIIVIAVVSIFLLLSVFAVRIPFFSKELYCKTFFHIQKSSVMPSNLRVEQSYCASENAVTKLVITNSSLIVNQTAASVVGCWKLAEQGLYNKGLLCTALVIRVNEDVDFGSANITEVLAVNNIQDFFNFNNNLTVSDIAIKKGVEKTILVEYEPLGKTIRVY